ncbi:MAG TPA: hypothetical protein VK427_11935 [Kofleriaceae bacterium]|nr:hypothetical protein [Kofleriaceae bacterium]
MAWDGHRSPAYADDDEEDGDDGGDDDGGGDGGGDDDGDESEEGDDKDQPAITAGGLYTKKTFPVRENERPLTITQNLTQARLGVGTDVSNKGAFKTAGVTLEALHGYRDNFMLLAGFTSAYNAAQYNVYAGFEGALYYDLIDLRVAARFGRAARNVSTDPEMVDYVGGKTKYAVDIGFPFRYVARPEIAIVALQTVMSVDLNATGCMTVQDKEECANEVTPDLNPSLGIVTNPIEPVSLVVQAQLQVVDFDFTNKLRVPATIRIQFSPTRLIDIGGEFTLLNVQPAEGEGSAFDNRFLSLFMAARFGK